MRILYTIAFALLMIGSNAQITSRTAAPKDVESKTYDGSKPFYGYNDLNQYVGTEIYFAAPSTEYVNERNIKGWDGNTDFYKSIPRVEGEETNVYSPIHDGYNYYTESAAIQGQTFTIKAIVDRSKLPYSEKDRAIFFQLQPVDGGTNFYYELAPKIEALRGDTTPQFYLPARFKYINEKYVGANYIAKETIEGATDNNTGEVIAIPEGSEWFFVEYTMLNMAHYRDEMPFMIFKNSQGNEVAVQFNKYGSKEVPCSLGKFRRKS